MGSGSVELPAYILPTVGLEGSGSQNTLRHLSRLQKDSERSSSPTGVAYGCSPTTGPSLFFPKSPPTAPSLSTHMTDILTPMILPEVFTAYNKMTFRGEGA